MFKERANFSEADLTSADFKNSDLAIWGDKSGINKMKAPATKRLPALYTRHVLLHRNLSYGNF
ncbi:pentapeptide repeat-containing protein [Chitinophaga sp. 22536]|uniref:pentapeptide repeat-containing protein n=1 Tax=unclassified Chitinophaga TaxID=2619133 RepID=UPI003F86DC23